MMAANVLQSAQLIGDACKSFDENCATGIEPNHTRIKELVNKFFNVGHRFKYQNWVLQSC